jgi:TnpA family transposase
LQENKSKVQPDTIHADTQGQSTAILAWLFCSELNSCRGFATGRIKTCFGQRPHVSYKHIDELFTAQVDWDLIATLLPDMMRVAVSIRTGKGGGKPTPAKTLETRS